jgi:hypothetical protein
MKRVVKEDGAGVFVTGPEGEKLRPEGRTRFAPETKVAVEMLGCAYAGATRAALWNPDRPRDLTEEVWDSGRKADEGYPPNDHVLCLSVRRFSSTCIKAMPDSKEEWCEVCLARFPLNLDRPDKPWHGVTPEERLLLIATVARRERLNLKPLGERWLVAREIAAMFPEVDGRGERAIQQWVVDSVRPLTERVHAPSLDQAAHYAATRFGLDERVMLETRETSSHGEYLVKFVRLR